MRPQELNLLVVFDAIMTEGSISRAADRLAMTQPAVSNAVARMRVLWKDTLFVKDGRTIQPTVYAQNLWSQIRDPLKNLSAAIDPVSFDPATAKRTFRLCAADVVVDIVWKPLRKIIEHQAPNIDIHAFPYTIVNAERALNDAEVDLVVGAAVTMPNTITSEFLFNSKYVCVMRPDHPLTKKPLTLEAFARAQHLLVSLSGDTTGFTDQVLAQHDLKRRIAMTVNHFSTVPSLLMDSDLIAIVPSTAVGETIFEGSLVVMQTPIEIPPNQVACFWHKRQEKDPGFSWLRKQFSKILKDYAKEHYKKLESRFCNTQ